MKKIIAITFACLVNSVFGLYFSSAAEEPKRTIENQLIDYETFERITVQSQQPREDKRLTEEEFLKAIQSKDAVLLDARSAANFKLRHVKGAVNLPLTEFTEKSLKKVIPNKATKIFIYCNNNFLGSPKAFANKNPAASLNLVTQVNLRAYGYRNIHELGPLLHVKKTKIPFEGIEVNMKNSRQNPDR